MLMTREARLTEEHGCAVRTMCFCKILITCTTQRAIVVGNNTMRRMPRGEKVVNECDQQGDYTKVYVCKRYCFGRYKYLVGSKTKSRMPKAM